MDITNKRSAYRSAKALSYVAKLEHDAARLDATAKQYQDRAIDKRLEMTELLKKISEGCAPAPPGACRSCGAADAKSSQGACGPCALR